VSSETQICRILDGLNCYISSSERYQASARKNIEVSLEAVRDPATLRTFSESSKKKLIVLWRKGDYQRRSDETFTGSPRSLKRQRLSSRTRALLFSDKLSRRRRLRLAACKPQESIYRRQYVFLSAHYTSPLLFFLSSRISSLSLVWKVHQPREQHILSVLCCLRAPGPTARP
jgi:hypothetical protein